MKSWKAPTIMAIVFILSFVVTTAGLAGEDYNAVSFQAIDTVNKLECGDAHALMAKKNNDKKEKRKIAKALKKAGKKGDKGEGSGGMASKTNMGGSRQVTRPPTVIIEGSGTVRH